MEKEIMVMKTLQVTKLEKQVLEALASGMYAELGYSDMGIADIHQDTQIPRNVIRGVASSLIKKGLISIDDRESEGYKHQMDMHIWYLTSETEGLVEKWVGQEDWFRKTAVEKVILEVKE
jgi:hypothetical protein